jgi:hypothetical protein
MLDQMAPGEFETWWRDYQREPWGDDWLQTSASATAIINEIRCQLCKDIKKEDLLKPDALVPKPTDEDNQPAVGNLTNSLTIMRARAGV